MTETPAELPAHLDFALRLHVRLNPDPAAQTCVSPYCLAAALDLLATGAAGATRAELVRLLTGAGDLTGHGEFLRAAAGLHVDPLVDEVPVLATSAALWADAALRVRQEFRRTLTARPNGSVRTADFAADPAGVRDLVNAEVAELTRGLIPEALPAGTPDRDTRMLLVTVLYLRTSWHAPFRRARTVPAEFHAPHGPRTVRMMRRGGEIDYAHTGGWQVIGLDAHGGVQATVLLPDGDLDAAESTMDGQRLVGLLAAQRPTRLALHLPRFALYQNASLLDVLAGLGARSMATDTADFSGIAAGAPGVSAVRHSAVLRVDESGMEGAAVTAVAMKSSARFGGGLPQVRVDRPFLVLVRHARTGAVYFLGRVTEPPAVEADSSAL